MTQAPKALPTRTAYRLWAESYDAETVVTSLEDRLVTRLTAGVVADVLLDAGCGTGRRMAAPPPSVGRAVGVDVVREMLEAGRRSDPRRRSLVVADVRALPFRHQTFGLVWCRLVVGHLSELAPLYHELRRVTLRGGRLIVSDFHPLAAAAGHTRTFRDTVGRLHTVEHHVHLVEDHRRIAQEAGWSLVEAVDAVPGAAERPYYEEAGRSAQFDRERSLPLVLVLSFVA